MISVRTLRAAILCMAMMPWPSAAGAATLSLAWDPVASPAIGYRVFWGIQSGTYPNTMDAGAQPTARVTGLTEGATYFFVVRSYDAQGNLSQASNEVVAVVPIGSTAVSNHVDFNGDGSIDLLWQHDTSRQGAVWFMGGLQGTALLGYEWLSGGMTGWTLAASADFNRDGAVDLVWQHDTTRQVAVWYLTGSLGASLLRWDWISPSGVAGWRVAAAGDLDRDGASDLVWQHDTTRQAIVWYLGGAGGNTVLSWHWLSSDGVPGWSITGLGDFNRDGVLDLIWQQDATRQVAAWYLGGSGGRVSSSWSWLTTANQPGWTVVGTRDWNRDGTADLIWLNESTRQVSVWYMGGTQGSTRVGQGWLVAAGVPGWRALAR